MADTWFGSRRISFFLNWFVVIGTIAVALIISFLFTSESAAEKLKFVAAVVGGAGALVAAVNALDARAAQRQGARKMAALDFAIRWDAPEFQEVRKYRRETVAQLKREHKSLKDLNEDSP